MSVTNCHFPGRPSMTSFQHSVYARPANAERLGNLGRANALESRLADPRGHGKKDEAKKLLETRNFSRQRLEQARAVLVHSIALAQDVLHDRVPLDKALAATIRQP